MPGSYRDNASPGRDTGSVVLGSMVAAALGAALMYFLDPDSGRKRRAWVRQERGRLARTRREDRVADAVLVELVRTALGRTIANPHGIEVKAFDGRVVLKGPVTPEELAEIVACTQRVRGVREVDNRLSPHAAAGGSGTP
ncbi:MAG TPA: BON domain-containing protein [Usitatibacter sp.]|jgi:hypothetical protein|nr:BON domain-containing protein [Usitatibacter sp.]